MNAFAVGESKRESERKESRSTVLKKEELNVEDDDEGDDYLKDLMLFDEDDADVDEYLVEQNDEEGGSGGGSDAWTVAEGQPVEVWDRGRLVLGNVLSLPVGEEASGHSSSSSSSLGVLRVLVFEPSETVGSARDDDSDDFEALRSLPKVVAAEAARRVLLVPLDQARERPFSPTSSDI